VAVADQILGIGGASGEALERHPVFKALPEKAQWAFARSAEEQRVLPGEIIAGTGKLSLIASGVLGREPACGSIIVGLVGPGASVGWSGALNGETRLVRAISHSFAFQAPLEPVIESLGRDWLHKFIARRSSSQIHELEREAACNAKHRLLPRLAKWLARMSVTAGAVALPLTQDQLARMLGVQRTTLNAAAVELQASELVSFRRGRMAVLNLEGLSKLACSCLQEGLTAHR